MSVMSSNTPRGHWPLKRIIEVFQGKDGRVSVVRVQVGNNQFTIPLFRHFYMRTAVKGHRRKKQNKKRIHRNETKIFEDKDN